MHKFRCEHYLVCWIWRLKLEVSDIHDLDIDDLLGREIVEPDQVLLSKTVTNKTVMITGAGGSIGSELSRQIADLQPSEIILVEQSEFALYSIHQELDDINKKARIVPLLASVQDKEKLREIVSVWTPDTIFHAAAYKHVPLVEHNLIEGVKNNVLGNFEHGSSGNKLRRRKFCIDKY